MPHQIVVVGGGPAGTAAAAWLARHGYDVALLEKGGADRDKVCGDAILPDTVNALDEIGVWPEIRPHLYGIKSLRAYSPGGYSTDIGGRIYTCKRAVFDAALRRACAGQGVAVVHGAEVVAIDRAADKIVLTARMPDGETRRYETAFCIVATGASPKAIELFTGGKAPKPSAFAVRRYVSFPRPHGIDHLKIWYSKEASPGYAWAFPMSDTELNVGAGVFADANGEMRKNVNAIFREFFANNREMKALLADATAETRLAGSPIRASLRGCERVFDRMLLCGEAIGSTYAMSGEGIGKAMETGIIAARRVDAAFAAGDLSSRGLAAYADDLERGLRAKFDNYERGQKWMRFGFVLDILARVASSDARVRSILEDMLEEKKDPTEIFSFRGIVRRLLLRV